ncbi:Eco57I restriction-modification methylase domain-containing protein [Salinarimonas sp.]|uniref:HsdM family class I SAM-dependent methyltransferase n=1 Tax=Salinarimonas sp. TaxID=2766526 RepID=UPI0032D960E9
MNFLPPSGFLEGQTPAMDRLDAARSSLIRFVASLGDEARRKAAAAIAYRMATSWWQDSTGNAPAFRLRKPNFNGPLLPLPQHVRESAESIGIVGAALPCAEANELIGSIYAACLPSAHRGATGVFYTPRAIVSRLLDGIQVAGVDWATARIIDPACGSGAFLVQCAERMIASRAKAPSNEAGADIRARLTGWEIDPTAAWLSQVSIDLVLYRATRLPEASRQSVLIVDSLKKADIEPSYDCVVGNPPYGRVRLDGRDRQRFARSLYGHANLYGVFTDLALRIANERGVIGYVSPASFLAGEYFKNLRGVIRSEARVVHIDFVSARKGVFDTVLQETVLSIYKKSDRSRRVSVSDLRFKSGTECAVTKVGDLELAGKPGAPWIIPRTGDGVRLVESMGRMKARLIDWGYAVSTGPLVWNRHKEQICSEERQGCYPLIWAECVRPDGTFAPPSKRRGHQPFFCPAPGESRWLLTHRQCVLLQRTTAKEQDRRLVATLLPADLLARAGAVVVENHLNMVRPLVDKPAISPEVVAAFLNSSAADRAFRCLSGSVAVSAYELEALPLPPARKLARFAGLVLRGDSAAALDAELARLYGEGAEGELVAEDVDATANRRAAAADLPSGDTKAELLYARARG